MIPYYQDETSIIYNADCREILPSLDQSDLVITDPPFSDFTHKNAKSNQGANHGNSRINFESLTFEQIHEILGATNPKRWLVTFLDFRQVLSCIEEPPANFEFVRMGVWLKTNPMPQISADRPAHGWDAICYLHNKDEKKTWNGGGRSGNFIESLVSNGDHPTGKPIKIINTMVQNFSNPGDLILDPFMGSGTTLRACKELGRRAIGIELDEKYCEIAARRLSQEVFNFN